LAIASALALADGIALAAVDPVRVARYMPPGFVAYGRPSNATRLHLVIARLRYLLDGLWRRQDDGHWEVQRLGNTANIRRP
jgi:hypothetical protein